MRTSLSDGFYTSGGSKLTFYWGPSKMGKLWVLNRPQVSIVSQKEPRQSTKRAQRMLVSARFHSL